jgi:hypothetical protein
MPHFDDRTVRTEMNGPNRVALTTFIKNQYPDGIPATDLPIVQTALSLAEAVDAAPDHASLWLQYRAAIADVRTLTDNGNAIDNLLAELRTTDSHRAD